MKRPGIAGVSGLPEATTEDRYADRLPKGIGSRTPLVCEMWHDREYLPKQLLPIMSPAQAQTLDERPVPIDVLLLQVVEEPPATTDQ